MVSSLTSLLVYMYDSPQHRYVNELRHVSVSVSRVLLLERGSDQRALFGDNRALLRGRLAPAHGADQLAKFHRHFFFAQGLFSSSDSLSRSR